VCARLLREHASVFGRTERYTIYDQADMRRVIDWLISDAKRGEIQRALADYGQPASAEVLAEISRAKNALLSPDAYERSATHPGARLNRCELGAGRSIGHVAIATVTMPGGLVRHYEHQRDHTPDPDRRRDVERVLEDLRSLCRAAQACEEHDDHVALTGFLERAAGLHAQELDAATDRRITVSTIHRAKGTEAQAVALLGCEEELLPSWRSMSSPDPERLAEERRLFYVAATRAKDRLLITHVAERGRRATGGPSRFLAEAGLCQTDCSLAA
jgi:superfamily I DNA/RNA helicase